MEQQKCFQSQNEISIKLASRQLLFVRLYLWTPPIDFWISEPVFMKFGIYITASEPTSTAYFISPSHQSVCLHVYPRFIPR
jgi:hypothetical protein